MSASQAAPPTWAGPPRWANTPGGPTTPNFKHLYVFGDSLSDTGNDQLLTGAQFFTPTIPPSQSPNRAYFDGRFSNGPVSVEHLWRLLKGDNIEILPSLAAVPSPSANTAISYAFGATDTGPGGPTVGGFWAPGLQTQVEIFASGLQSRPAPSNGLYIVWAGANDYLFYQATDPNLVVGNVIKAVERLYSLGARHFLVPNLPDMSLAPLVQMHGPAVVAAVSQLTQGHNAVLAQALAALPARLPKAQIRHVDTYLWFHYHIGIGTFQLGPPALDTLVPGSGACLLQNPATCPDVPLNAPIPPLVFWDMLHPTAGVHELFGRAMFEALAK